MSPAAALDGLDPGRVQRALAAATAADVRQAVGAGASGPEILLALLSPAARPFLEDMAQESRRRTLRDFGRGVLLYAPVYLANFCQNGCRYCGFHAGSPLPRRALAPEEIEAEAAALAATGIRHVLALTGESRLHSPPGWIADGVRVLRRRFASVSLEIYPLQEDEYRQQVEAGADGLTIYQEVYDPDIYADMHPFGPKRDRRFRLEAPERACRAGMRFVNLGVLLGLGEWRAEAYALGLHLLALQAAFPGVEFSVSFPRMRPHAGGLEPPRPVDDAALVQMMLALKLAVPRLGLTLSTREDAALRDRLVPLGVTRLSAGSRTSVGAYSLGGGGQQFEIRDDRSVAEVSAALAAAGYQPVFKDWTSLA